MAMVLAGDIGGTHTRLALVDLACPQSLTVVTQQRYRSSAFTDLLVLIDTFVKQSGTPLSEIVSVCFAVAGPIQEGCVRFTNLPWIVEEKQLHKLFKGRHVALINDFEAVAHGIDSLDASDLVVLQKGQDNAPEAPRALIGAGTGLGVALMLPGAQGQYRVFPTEGGHVDFAPTDEMQMALLTHMRKYYHRVSDERFVSGLGLLNIYKYVRDHPLYGEAECEALRHAVHSGKNVAAAISEHAHQHADPMALRAIDLFIKMYGSVVGNLALTTLPYAGLYIGGGIAPKLIDIMQDGRFMTAFADKGRMSNLLSRIPIYVIMNTDVGLRGAACHALANSS